MSQAIGNTRLAYIRLWHRADASGRILGKFAARIANVLMGKHKPTWHPSLDYGDYVVVTNARKIVVSGNKEDQIVYRHHTMFPGGLHERKYKNLMKEQPEEILRLAVAGMLPKNTLRDRRMERLKIFEADEVEGGLGGNLTSSWGSLVESRSLLAPSAKDGASTADLLGTTSVDWTKPLPSSLRTAKSRRTSKGTNGINAKVMHSTKVKTKVPKLMKPSTQTGSALDATVLA